MASLLYRSAANVVRRSTLISAVRMSSETPKVDPERGKVASDKVSMPDTLGHAVGAERFELLARLAGNEDPFDMNVKSRAKGTVDEPTLIPSLYDSRIVGCICEEDAVSITWMTLHKGEQKRCMCGYYFKLVPLEYKDYGQ
ncbi:hypothetical protein LSH36_25g04033 [Paralvinella palmiformis]|uniref:Uncharacterized protein n=1 Tax=Paralvinella palmiformis TaxID=53620 RepID=A0AAD9KAT0_9ANNE|nr:hypothetical protein LSH36_25g04033 [Paralvinella palmiformis]